MNTVTVDGLSRTECALMVTFVILDGLVAKGMLDGPRNMATPEGREVETKLKEAGFEFNEGELIECMDYIYNHFAKEAATPCN